MSEPKKGPNSGNGRPKGALNRTTRQVKDALAEAFNELQDDPVVCLAAWGRANPTPFYQLAGKLIPSKVEGEITHKGLAALLAAK